MAGRERQSQREDGEHRRDSGGRHAEVTDRQEIDKRTRPSIDEGLEHACGRLTIVEDGINGREKIAV